MDKQEKLQKIKKRTWKYFREQKWKEVKSFFEGTFPIIFLISIFFGVFSQIGLLTNPETGERWGPVIAMIGLCILGFWVLLLFIHLILCFIDWLSSNWKKAKKKAEKDFK